jgi:hypothetical protein
MTSLLLSLSVSPHHRACVHFDATFVTPTPRALGAACLFGYETEALALLSGLGASDPRERDQRDQRARHQLARAMFGESLSPLHHAAHLGHLALGEALVTRLGLGLESRRESDLFTPLLAAVAGLDLPRWHLLCRAATVPFVSDTARRSGRTTGSLRMGSSNWLYGLRMAVSLPVLATALNHGTQWQLDAVDRSYDEAVTTESCEAPVSFDPKTAGGGTVNDWRMPHAAWARLLSHVAFAEQLDAWNRAGRTVLLWLVDLPAHTGVAPATGSTLFISSYAASLTDLVRHVQGQVDDTVMLSEHVVLDQSPFLDGYLATKAAITDEVQAQRATEATHAYTVRVSAAAPKLCTRAKSASSTPSESRWFCHIWVTGPTVAAQVLTMLASPAGQLRAENMSERAHVFCVAPFDAHAVLPAGAPATVGGMVAG